MNFWQRRLALAASLISFGLLTAEADTLVLRNGRSYSGELVSVRDGSVQFRTNRGRTERFDVDRVDRIEFSESRSSRSDRDRGTRGDERPSGLREREIQVAGAKAWTDTSIQLRDGQNLWFDSRGEVRWGPGRKDGPDGEGGNHHNPARPIPSRPGASLVGKIGESGDPFFIGDSRGPIRVRGRGTLFLGINDDYLQDNSGAFRVIVYY